MTFKDNNQNQEINQFTQAASSKSATSKKATTAARKYTLLRTIELQIMELEGVLVIFRHPGNLAVSGPGYDYKKRLKEGSTIRHLVSRIQRALGTTDIPFVIVRGDGKIARKGHDGQPLKRIIESYNTASQARK